MKMMAIITCEERTRQLVHNLPKVINLASMPTKILFYFSTCTYILISIYCMKAIREHRAMRKTKRPIKL